MAAIPTQRELARRLGLTQATVSMALHGSPRISQATRKLVAETAKLIGYRPDAAVGALSKRRWNHTLPTGVAYISARGTGTDSYRPHVAARCEHLGLRLWEIPTMGLDDLEVQRGLRQRKIAGVILGQTGRFERAWELDLTRVRAVHCGMFVLPTHGDVVCADLPPTVGMVWREMTNAGYQSIAAIMLHDDPRAHSEQLLSGATLMLERHINDQRRFRTYIGRYEELEDAMRWLVQYPPQAVIVYHSEFGRYMRERNIQLPYANLVTRIGDMRYAGAGFPEQDIAEYAVDLLVSRMRDPPLSTKLRCQHQLEMRWQPGESLPMRRI